MNNMRKMILAVAAIGFNIFSLGAEPAMAQQKLTHEVAGRELTFVIPEGQCVMDESFDADREFLGVLKKDITPRMLIWVGAFAPCENLTSWRETGKNGPGGHGYGYIVINPGNSGVPKPVTQKNVNETHGQRIYEAPEPEALTARIERALKEWVGATVNTRQMELIGNLHADDNGFYYVMLEHIFENPGSTGIVGINITSVLALSEQIVFLYHVAPATGDPGEVQALLETAKTVSTLQHGANR